MFVTSVVRRSPSIVLLCLVGWGVLQVRKRFDVQGGPFVAGMTGFFCLRFVFVLLFCLRGVSLGFSEGLSSVDSPTPRTVTNAPSPSITTARELEPHEQEVEELLAWTNTLP